jgi:hypothetical protein
MTLCSLVGVADISTDITASVYPEEEAARSTNKFPNFGTGFYFLIH